MSDDNEVTIIILIDNKVLAIKTSKAKVASLLSLNTPQTSTQDNSVLRMSVGESIKTDEKYN